MRCLLAFIVLLSLDGCTPPEPSAAPPRLPATETVQQAQGPRPTAPSWSLQDLDGQTHQLEDFRGRIILLNFWATWCPPCREEIPEIVELYNAYRDRGVTAIGIAMESGSRRALLSFVEGFRITYPILIGDLTVAQRYRVSGVPTSFLLDREGRVAKRWLGPYTKEDFAAVIETVLAEESP